MLVNLHIENFALMNKIDIGFSKGLNVLTGETGAGKSIIIDATNFVLGGRGSQEFIRSGYEKAYCEAFFQVHLTQPLQKKLEEYGLLEETGEIITDIILGREIARNGKNHCRINGRTFTLAAYKEIGQYLIDIHGQHDHQSLMNVKRHYEFLDNYGGQEVLGLRKDLNEVFRELTYIRKNIERTLTEEREKIRLKDMLDFQINEIANANVLDNEDSQLTQEKKILSNAEKLTNLTEKSYQLLLYGDKGQLAISDGLVEVLNNLKELEKIDGNLVPLKNKFEEAYYLIEDTIYQIRDYKDNLLFEPYRLQEIDNRLELIKQLKKKYGAEISDIKEFYNSAKDQLDKLQNEEIIISELHNKQTILEQRYRNLAKELCNKRKEVALELEKEIQKQLADLHMPKVKFSVAIENITTESVDGMDNIEFLISPNHGEPLKPLAKTASGGELSRFMLAMKTILAKADDIPTLIFDEVDTGVGGAALVGVAEKLAILGGEKQVICVTHAPRIAGYAENHIAIKKQTVDDRTETSVITLNEQERIEEIARMLSGNEVSDHTLSHARELLRKIN